MISNKLIDDLGPILSQAKEVWVAVALMKDSALSNILQTIPKAAKQNYLVGIDLPTTPSVLKSLKSLKSQTFKAGIFKTTKTFHPKVYIISDGDKLSAIVGSANLTDGGLSNNIEMSLVTHDQDVCNSLLDWFNRLYSTAFPLTEENINAYDERFKGIEEAEKSLKVARSAVKLKKPENAGNPLDGIDFTDRYFKYEHHNAFRSSIWENRTKEADKERRKAYDRFYDLHDTIFPFSAKGLSNLDHHKMDRYIVSHYDHVDGFTSQQLSAMWLSYGKNRKVIKKYQDEFSSKNELDSDRDTQSFINHARLQVIMHYDNIGIWLFFGKRNGGSVFDRNFFQKEMQKEAYRDEFFKKFSSLPTEYYISLADNEAYHVDYFPNSESLYKYCKQDNLKNHFIVGRDYQIEDDDMSLSRLPTTVLKEFERLYPLYDTMRDRMFG